MRGVVLRQKPVQVPVGCEGAEPISQMRNWGLRRQRDRMCPLEEGLRTEAWESQRHLG